MTTKRLKPWRYKRCADHAHHNDNRTRPRECQECSEGIRAIVEEGAHKGVTRAAIEGTRGKR